MKDGASKSVGEIKDGKLQKASAPESSTFENPHVAYLWRTYFMRVGLTDMNQIRTCSLI